MFPKKEGRKLQDAKSLGRKGKDKIDCSGETRRKKKVGTVY